MRKITQDAVDCFINRKPFSLSNTEVVIDNKCRWRLTLFGNTIAYMTLGLGWDSLQVTTSGKNTATTRERLNGLPGVSVYQKKGSLYLNGKEWDGSLVDIEDWDNGLYDPPNGLYYQGEEVMDEDDFIQAGIDARGGVSHEQ